MAMTIQVGLRNSFAPAEVSAELCAIGGPLTAKLAPGNDLNAAFNAGSLTKSCAQATGPNKINIPGDLRQKEDLVSRRQTARQLSAATLRR